MKNNIGITFNDGIKQEIILESLKVLAGIEKKYNCKFEFSNELGSSKLKLKLPKFIKKTEIEGTGLYSFGGEMDL
jgi:isocitrate/isopropylmalate dehydrogenase